MLNRLADAMEIIDADVADPRPLGADIHEHQGHFADLEVLQQTFLQPEREHGHTFYTSFDHAPDRTLHTFWIVAGRAQQNLVTMLDRNRLKPLHDFWEEWIGDIRDNQSEDPASSRDKRARLGIRVVAEFFNDIPDTLGHLGIHGWYMIDNARNRRRGNACPFCDLPDIHTLDRDFSTVNVPLEWLDWSQRPGQHVGFCDNPAPPWGG